MEVMRQRNLIYKLASNIQIDDAYQGGEKPGKRGRGAANKTPFVIAVETRGGRPIYTHMRVLPGFTKEAIRDYAKASIKPGSRCPSRFNGVAEADLRHVVRIPGNGHPAGSDFKWVDTGPGQRQECHHGHAAPVRSAACAPLSRSLRAEGAACNLVSAESA